jgi:hypothetical protein
MGLAAMLFLIWYSEARWPYSVHMSYGSVGSWHFSFMLSKSTFYGGLRIEGERVPMTEEQALRSDPAMPPILFRKVFAPRQWLPEFSRFSFGPDRYVWVGIPLWLPGVLFAALVAIGILRKPPAPPGYCRHCRYDLRSLPEASVCPECGKARKALKPH